MSLTAQRCLSDWLYSLDIFVLDAWHIMNDICRLKNIV